MALDKQSLKLPVFSRQLFLSYGLCLLMLVAPFLRGLYFEEYFLPFTIGISILFIIYIYEQYKRRESGFFSHPIDWAMLALLLAYLFSLFPAVNIRAAVGGLMKYAAYFMVFWMCCWTARQENGANLILWIVYLAGAGMAIFGLLVYCDIISYPYGQDDSGRIGGTLEYANTFGAYLAVVFFIGWAFIVSNQQSIIRALLAGVNTFIIMAMLASLSRGTWLLFPLAVLFFVIMVGHGKRLEAGAVWLVSLIPGLIMGRSLMASPQSPHLIYLLWAFLFAVGAQIGLDSLGKYLGTKIKLSGRVLWITILATTILIISLLVFSYSEWSSYFTQGTLERLTNISQQDESMQLRIEFNQDAFKIIKDHPIIGVGTGGWEALYHRYASHLYWTTKTHNFFLQTWVEAGTFGFLALLAVWLAFVDLLRKYWKKLRDENHSDLLFWGGATAVFLLGIHSFIDFDMSYPAVAFLLFGLMGILQGKSSPIGCSNESLVSKQGAKKRKNSKPTDLKNTELISAITASIMAVVLLLSSASFWIAGINFRSAQKILNQDPNQGLVLLNKSMQYDPMNASYVNQAANFYAAVATSTQNQTAYQQAIDLCQKAINLEPYNVKILNNVNNIFLQLGQPEQAIKVAETLIQVNPLDPSTYENLANTMVTAGLYSLDTGQMEKARSYWSNSINVADRVPPNLTLPAIGLNYISGQAMLLLGNKEQGQETIKKIFFASSGPATSLNQQRIDQVDGYRLQARIWLTADLELSNRLTEAKSYFDVIPAAQQTQMAPYLQRVKAWLQKANPSQ